MRIAIIAVMVMAMAMRGMIGKRLRYKEVTA